jgi:bacillaene synthase trans-acting acyltransferase
MKNEIVFMFSGQGSQYLNMGREFYESLTLYRKRMQHLDEIAQEYIGYSIVDILYNNPSRAPEKMDNILHTHPALFMVQHAIAQCLIYDGVIPSYVVGTSLGEIVALSVSGALAPEDAMQVVVKHALLLSQKSPPGGMMAVLEPIQHIQQYHMTATGCELAGINFSTHYCLSGSCEALHRAAVQLESRNAIYDYLPVKQPFHSSLIDPLKAEFLQAFEGIEFKTPQIPIISSMAAECLEDYSPETLWKVVRNPIIFQKTLSLFQHETASTRFTNTTYLDLGPSGTLANFVKYGQQQSDQTAINAVMSPFGNDLPKYKSLILQQSEHTFFRGA